MKIGWIGLGNMGSPMVTNILKAGYELYLYNRNKDKVKDLTEKGAVLKESPKEVAELADIIFTIVSDDDAVRDVYKREDGVLAGLQTGKIAVDMSTISPDTTKEIASLCRNKGAEMLDAPVSGTVGPAREGTLVILVGGKKEAFEKSLPLFNVLGKAVFYLGENGSGNNAKLAVNSMLGVIVQALAEAVLLAEKSGISRETMLEIIQLSAAGSPIVNVKAQSIIDNQFPVAFALKLAAKDLRLALERAEKAEIELPLLEKSALSFKKAAEEGKGDLDVMGILSFLNKHK